MSHFTAASGGNNSRAPERGRVPARPARALRAGADTDQAIDALARWRHNIHLVHQLVQNDVSSTKVRLFIRRGLSVRYLLPAPVVEYIEARGLYADDAPGAHSAEGAFLAEKDKGKEKEGAAPTASAAS